MVRLERLLSNRGYCARSDSREYLKEHDVRAGDVRLSRGDVRVDPATIIIDGEPIDPETVLLMMNKPVGIVCSHREDAGGGGPSGPLVYSLLPQRYQYRDPTISSVGRLDKETSGLLLLTDDGALLHKLTSPKHHVPRVYHAVLDRDMKGNEAMVFASGTLMLDNETKPLLPAELEVIGPREARLTLHEGRYHQVRRMFAATGNHVLQLHRERFGPLTLSNLTPGEWRHIQKEDVFLVICHSDLQLNLFGQVKK